MRLAVDAVEAQQVQAEGFLAFQSLNCWVAYDLVMAALSYAACGNAEPKHDETAPLLEEAKPSFDVRRFTYAGMAA